MEEHEDLWKAYRAGDRSAYEKLVDLYLPLVKVTVGRLSMTIPSYISREDLYSAGCLGLVSAIERYDPSREAKFTTYAITRIRGAIIDELRHHDVLGRVTRDRVQRIQEAESNLANENKEITAEEVAAKAGLTMEEYWDAELGIQAARMISLSELAEDGEHSLADLLPQRTSQEPGYEMELDELIQVVTNMLTERQKMLVVLYYHKELTLKEIGKIMNISESRVCQLHAEMVQEVRKKLKKIGVLL